MSTSFVRLFSFLMTLGLIVTASSGAKATDTAQVRARVTALREKPDGSARSVLKLGKGREVAVIAKSDDGEWIHVSGSIEHAQDTVPFDGWVEAADLSGGAVASAPVAKSSGSASSGNDSWGSSGDGAKAAAASDDSWAPSADDVKAAAKEVNGGAGDNSWDAAGSDSKPAGDGGSKSSSDDGW